MKVDRILSESNIVRTLSVNVCKRLTRQVIADLQRMKDCLLSGEGSNLKNIWEEICVQLQSEYSFSWNAYVETVNALVVFYVSELADYEKEAIWLHTEQAIDWDCDNDDEREPYPVFDEDIVRYIISDYVFEAASNWSNSRIRAFLNQY